MSYIAPVVKLVEPAVLLVLTSITDERGPLQPGTGIIFWLEVLTGGIAETAIPTQLSALSPMPIANVASGTLAEYRTGIFRFIEGAMRMRNPVALDFLGEGRWIFAQKSSNGG